MGLGSPTVILEPSEMKETGVKSVSRYAKSVRSVGMATWKRPSVTVTVVSTDSPRTIRTVSGAFSENWPTTWVVLPAFGAQAAASIAAAARSVR